MNRTGYQRGVTLPLIGVILASALGFGLRYIFLQRMIIHVDEFTSLLGIKMVLDKGIPVYPSNVFEGKGIVYSYLGAGVSALFSFSIENIRYLSLVSGVLTIPLVYWVVFKLFKNKASAFLAALLFTIHPEAVAWSARARMYSLATFFVFLIILVCWQSIEQQKIKPLYFMLVPLTILTALLTHLAIIINIPAILLALVITYWFLNKPRINLPKDWFGLAFVIASIVVVAALGSWIGRQPGEIRQWEEEASLLSDIKYMLLEFGLLEKMYLYFLSLNNLIATFFSLAGIVALINKARYHNLAKIDFAAIFIYIQLITTFLLLYLFVPSNVRDSRHNFIVLLPFLALTMAYGITVVSHFLQTFLNTRPYAIRVFNGIVIALLLIEQWLGINNLLFSGDSNMYRYDLATSLIKAQMQPGDQQLAVASAASYLFEAPADFYANQHKPRFIKDTKTGQFIDYYTGSVYLASVDDFLKTLALPGRLWFAVDEQRFARNFEPRFSQEVLHEMRLFDQIGNVMIFVERDDSWPMAEEPEFQTTTDFLDQAHLAGYATHLVGTDLQLTFFWKARKPLFNYKMFVHLRNQQGDTVAQADFSPYDYVIHMKNWQKVWGDELIRTGTVLHLPPEILNSDPSQYRLYVGLYAPEFNAQRVPVTDDVTGENAVILTDLGL